MSSVAVWKRIRDSVYEMLAMCAWRIKQTSSDLNQAKNFDPLIPSRATDYVAVPLRFSDGQINVLTLVSDQPGGFSTSHLARLPRS